MLWKEVEKIIREECYNKLYSIDISGTVLRDGWYINTCNYEITNNTVVLWNMEYYGIAILHT